MKRWKITFANPINRDTSVMVTCEAKSSEEAIRMSHYLLDDRFDNQEPTNIQQVREGR